MQKFFFLFLNPILKIITKIHNNALSLLELINLVSLSINYIFVTFYACSLRLQTISLDFICHNLTSP